MSGINAYLDSSGDPYTGAQIGGITEEVTVANKAWFDDGIFTAISGIVERLQGGSSGSRIRSSADFDTIQDAITSLPA